MRCDLLKPELRVPLGRAFCPYAVARLTFLSPSQNCFSLQCMANKTSQCLGPDTPKVKGNKPNTAPILRFLRSVFTDGQILACSSEQCKQQQPQTRDDGCLTSRSQNYMVSPRSVFPFEWDLASDRRFAKGVNRVQDELLLENLR